MTQRTRLLASTVGFLLIVAPIAGSIGSLGVQAAPAPEPTTNPGTAPTEPMAGMGVAPTSTNHTANSSVTPISECQAITESGAYELTADLADNETCLKILASNVTIHGNGHTVAQTGPRIRRTISRTLPAGIQVRGQDRRDRRENVTITNATIEGWQIGLQVQYTKDASFRNITVTKGDSEENIPGDSTEVQIDFWSTNISLTDSTLNGTRLQIIDSDHVEIRRTILQNSTISATGRDNITLSEIHGPTADVQAGGSNLTVTNSNLQSLETGGNARVANNSIQELRVSGSNIIVANNSLQSLQAYGSNITVVNNGPGEAGRFGITIRADSMEYSTIRGNNITGNTGEQGLDAGLTVRSAHNLSITNNTITNNAIGIHIREVRNRTARECVNGELQTVTLATGNIEIHQNTLADNGAGVQNEDTQTVNATHNYWGAATGPSSVTDVALEDPETGTLADGDGTTVSEHPEQAGVSNVRFDPWLGTDPTNSTA